MDVGSEDNKQFLAYMYLNNADKSKYGSLLKGLSTQQSLNNDQYPKSVTEANNVLSNHPFDNNKSSKTIKKGNIIRIEKTTSRRTNQKQTKKNYLCHSPNSKEDATVAESQGIGHQPVEIIRNLEKSGQSTRPNRAIYKRPRTQTTLPEAVMDRTTVDRTRATMVQRQLDGQEPTSTCHFIKPKLCETGSYWTVSPARQSFAIRIS